MFNEIRAAIGGEEFDAMSRGSWNLWNAEEGKEKKDESKIANDESRREKKPAAKKQKKKSKSAIGNAKAGKNVGTGEEKKGAKEVVPNIT